MASPATHAVSLHVCAWISQILAHRYEDVASHPLAVLLPYSVHSYGLVQAYAMGIPIVAPSLRLLSALHAQTGIMGHKGPGNVRPYTLLHCST